MKPDYTIIKRILAAVEEHESRDECPLEQPELELADIPEEIYLAHTALMTRDGLIESEKVAGIADSFPRYMPILLTGSGRDFLLATNNDTVWNQFLNGVAATGKYIGIPLAIETLKAIVKAHTSA